MRRRVSWFKLGVGTSVLPTNLFQPLCHLPLVVPKDVSNMTSGAHEHVTLHDRRGLASQVEMARLSWIFQGDPTSLQESLKVDEGSRKSESIHHRRMARKMQWSWL